MSVQYTQYYPVFPLSCPLMYGVVSLDILCTVVIAHVTLTLILACNQRQKYPEMHSMSNTFPIQSSPGSHLLWFRWLWVPMEAHFLIYLFTNNIAWVKGFRLCFVCLWIFCNTFRDPFIHHLRIPDGYDAKIAKTCSFWTFWPVFRLILT